MLVLSRKLMERILIGDDIIVTVCAIKPYQVRIGVEAPIGIRVDREEVRNGPDFRTESDYKGGKG